MKKILIFVLCAWFNLYEGYSQDISFNHNPDVMGQFTVAETGAGALPAGYSLWHKDYSNWAYTPENSKLFPRNVSQFNLRKQSIYADSIKSYLEHRAEEEAWNFADRMIVYDDRLPNNKRESTKVLNKIEDLERKIGYIIVAGGSQDDLWLWQMRTKCLRQGVEAVSGRYYMPNSQRTSQLLAISMDIQKYDRALTNLLVQWSALKKINRQNFQRKEFRRNVKQAAHTALGKWVYNFNSTNRRQ